LRKTGLLDSPPNEGFDRITRIGASLLKAPATFIALVDEHRDYYLSHCGFGEPLASTRQLTGQTFCHFTISGGEPLVIPDTRADPVYRKVPTVESLGVAAYLGVPLRLKTGTVIGSFCAIDFAPRGWTDAEIDGARDLAAMVVAEIELRERASAASAEGAKRAALLDSALSGIYEMDRDGRCAFINQTGAAMLGYTPAELVGKPIHETIHHSHADSRPYPVSECPIRISCLDGVPASVDSDVFWRNDGTAIPVQYACAPLRMDNEIAGSVVTFNDITERRAAELASRRFAAVVDSSDDAIITKTLDGIITSWNRGAQRVFGYSAEETIGMSMLILLPEDRKHEERDILARLARKERLDHFETVRQTKDGRLIDVSVTISPMVDSSGNLLGASKVARDITAAKTAERAVLRAKELAETATRELEAFSYSVAHDLRAPLRSIDGFSQALLEDYEDRLDDEGRKYLRQVRESAQQMAHLIDDLLSLSKVTRDEMEKHPVDLSALASKVAERLRKREPDRQIEVIIPSEKVMVDGDARLLGVAFENLLGNAWKFTGRQPAPRIEFAAHAGNGQPVYSVRDNGAGFDMQYADKLFGAFQRLHSSAEFDGTGIGLAIVQRVVRRHGGRIWGEGEVNRGATFYFTLGEDDA
jgi:PAS domain S-box-containing protein